MAISLADLRGKLDASDIDMAVLHAPGGHAPAARAMPLYRERDVVIVTPAIRSSGRTRCA